MSRQITVTYCGKQITVDSNTQISTIIGSGYIAAKADNQIVSLSYPLQTDCTVEPLTISDPAGMDVYRRSLTFLLGKVISEKFPKCRLRIGHSLGPGYYFDTDAQHLSQSDIDIIKEEMHAQISSDKPIVYDRLRYDDAIKRLSDSGRHDKVSLLMGINDPKIPVWQCDQYMEIFDGPLAIRTGLLGVFDIIPYHDGLIMQFPRKSDITKPAEFHPQEKIFAVYNKSRQFARRIGAGTIGDLNEMTASGKLSEFIQLSENLQLRNIIELADAIQSRPDIKLITIAGPSSSGKTTFSKRLSLQLKAAGITPVTISVDDYFIDRAKTPLGANGLPNYECLEALNVNALNENLKDLIDGKPTHLLHYDFMTGLSSVRPESVSLKSDEVLVIEGIHCLNDALTPAIPNDKKFKIYISALTQIGIDDDNRIPTTDNRLLRRIVRDAKYRGHSAQKTLSMWPNVRDGEEKYIFPYQNHADGYFNSALHYELAILKPYAEPLLRQIKPSSPQYADAVRLLRMLDYFLSADDDHVPGNSLIREFIGGSFFEY